MPSTIDRGSRPAAALLLACAVCSAAVAVTPEETMAGDLWQVTSTVSRSDRPAAQPVRQSKVCLPRQWSQPPAALEPRWDCTSSDFSADGPRATWSVSCANGLTGTGEAVRGGGSRFSGVVKLVSRDAEVSVQLDGRRLGECDAPSR